MNNNISHCILSIGLLLLLAACGATAAPVEPQKTGTANPSFRIQVSPAPTVPPYRCGSWVSTHSPNAYDTITIYARVTKNTVGVANATANAIVHFKYTDIPLNPKASSDLGGYLTFTIALQGRQPRQTPATVDVTVMVGQTKVPCSSTFFTPQ
jgi:hypothetical protein